MDGWFQYIRYVEGLTLFARFDYALGYKKWNSGYQYFMGITSGHFNVPDLAKRHGRKIIRVRNFRY